MRKTLLVVLLVLLVTCGSSVGGSQEYSGLPLSPTQEDLMPKYNVPISIDLQRYIWQQCQDKSLSYELVLAVIQVESEFKADAVSDTADYGLMQLNKYTTIGWLKKEIGLMDFNPIDPIHNVTAGIWYLAFLRDYWAQHYSDEQVFTMTLLSYHHGTEGARAYVRLHGMSSEYVNKVYEAKSTLERSLEQ